MRRSGFAFVRTCVGFFLASLTLTVPDRGAFTKGWRETITGVVRRATAPAPNARTARREQDAWVESRRGQEPNAREGLHLLHLLTRRCVHPSRAGLAARGAGSRLRGGRERPRHLQT